MRLLVSTARWWSMVASVLSLCLLAVAGCGSSSGLPGPTGQVSGRVTFQGKPVPLGTTVTFVHEEKALPAAAQTTADGTYPLVMRGGLKVLTGVYKVSVSAPAAVEDVTANPEAYKAVMEGRAAPPKAVAVLPAKYNSPETSGLVFEVKPGNNTINIDLKDKE